MGNWFKTTLLLGLMTALIVLIGKVIGGQQGMIYAFFLAIGMNFISYYFSDKIVLRMYRAREATPMENSRLYEIVHQIAQKANLPMPRVYIIPEDSPNAFATGRNPGHAVVAVTEGLVRLMDTDEVTGVLSHEMAHIKNRDILIGSIAATMAGAIMIIANMARWSAFLGGRSNNDRGGSNAIGLLILSILAPVAAMLIQMAISRSREYQADSTGAVFAGNPGGLARALEKLGAYSKRIPMQSSPNTAHMFIVNPLKGGNLSTLFSTHPPLEERIARLTGNNSLTDNILHGGTGRREAEDSWKRLMR